MAPAASLSASSKPPAAVRVQVKAAAVPAAKKAGKQAATDKANAQRQAVFRT